MTETTCTLCDGEGCRYDPTMANWVGNQGTGMVRCSRCNGTGVAKPVWLGSGEHIEDAKCAGGEIPAWFLGEE